MPRTSKCSAAAVPALMVPAGMSKSSGAGSRSYHSVTSVRVTPSPAAIWRTTLPQAMVSTPGRQQHGHVVQVAAEAHDVEEHHGLVVGVVVEHLGAAHLLDALADAREDERERVVGEARVHAVDEERDARLRRGGDQRGRHRVARLGVLQEDRARGHDVDPGGQEAFEVGERPRRCGRRPWRCARCSRARGRGGRRRRSSPRRRACGPARPARPASRPTLSGLETKSPDQLELGVGVDPGDRSGARRCRCSTARLGTACGVPPRGSRGRGAGISRLGDWRPPSTSRILPVT